MSGNDSGFIGAILGALILQPDILENSDVSADDFPAGRFRETFKGISEQWENSRPGEIDASLLSDKIGGNGSLTFISSLTIGFSKADRSPETFHRRLHELRRQSISRRLASKLKAATDLDLKTGNLDLADVRVILAELELLERPHSNVIPIASLEAKEINWLWPGRIPLGMFSLLAGAPGQGKSAVALALAAKLSRGFPLPDSGGIFLECDSLIVAAEDPIAQVVRPRAERNGADLSKIFVIDIEDLGTGEIFGRLRRALSQNPKIKFVVIDPLNAFLKAGTDYFRDPDVRRSLLRPLSVLAEESGAAVLGIVHLNKRTDESGALNRIGGSVAYGAAARSALTLGLDPDNDQRRLLAPAKCNYSKPPGTIAFTIGDGAKIDFDPIIVETSADEILQRRDPIQAAEGDYAAEWLLGLLKDGPVDLKDLLQAAKKESISRPTLFRIRKRVGIIARGSGFGRFKTSTWELPK